MQSNLCPPRDPKFVVVVDRRLLFRGCFMLQKFWSLQASGRYLEVAVNSGLTLLCLLTLNFFRIAFERCRLDKVSNVNEEKKKTDRKISFLAHPISPRFNESLRMFRSNYPSFIESHLIIGKDVFLSPSSDSSSIESKLPSTSSGVNFTDVLHAAFMHADPKSAKMTVNSSSFFCFLDHGSVKAAHKDVVEIDPWVQFIFIL